MIGATLLVLGKMLKQFHGTRSDAFNLVRSAGTFLSSRIADSRDIVAQFFRSGNNQVLFGVC